MTDPERSERNNRVRASAQLDQAIVWLRETLLRLDPGELRAFGCLMQEAEMGHTIAPTDDQMLFLVKLAAVGMGVVMRWVEGPDEDG